MLVYKASLTSNLVENIIRIDDSVVGFDPPDYITISGDRPNIGDVYDAQTGTFSPPVPTVVVPETVMAVQARKALADIGKLQDVEIYVASLPQENLARIWWDAYEDLHYSAPSLIAICAALGLDRDALFVAASKVDTSSI